MFWAVSNVLLHIVNDYMLKHFGNELQAELIGSTLSLHVQVRQIDVDRLTLTFQVASPMR